MNSYLGPDNTVTLANGVITNNGTMQFTAAANNVILGLNGGMTLNGGGTLNLSQSGAGSAVIQQQVGGLTLTNTDNTIQGAGNIGNGGGLAVINGGTINANASTQTLFLDTSGGITNNNLLEATNGGTLNIFATTVANAGANISAIGAGSAVLLTNSTINGGTLNASGGGTMGTAAGFTSTLNGVTISSGSTYTNGNNSDLFASGTITNNGTIQVNAGANNSILGLTASTTLSGGPR